MIDRIMRVVKLDFSVFKEIESDSNATSEAIIIVLITAVLSALGSAVGSGRFFGAFVGGVISSVVGWVVWAAVVYFLGKSLFAGKGSFEGLLRVLGYSRAPLILGILNAIPCIGWIGSLAGAILSLIMGIMAIKEGLDLETGQAVVVTLLGWLAFMVVTIVFAIIFGGLGAILGSFAGSR